jgi:purine nucleosidase
MLKRALLCLQTDPEAAKIVFECGAPVVMLPVELTHTALVTPDVLNRISAELVGNTPFLHLVKQLLLYFAESYKTVFKFDNPPLHDPCAVAYVIAPEMFQVCLNIAASAVCCCCFCC